MRFFIIILFFSLTTAAPTATTSSTTSRHIPQSTTTQKGAPHIQSTRVHSIQVITPPFLVTRTRPAAVLPSRTKEPPPFSRPPNRRPPRRSQKTITIVFEVLGGLVGSLLLLGLLRCFYKYKRAPKRDRIAEVYNRHHLQRELAELERNPAILRRPSLREPPPPYVPPPPTYDTAQQGSEMDSIQRAEYSVVPTHSPPSSPPQSRRTTQIPLTAQVSPALIPSMPSG
ncbi:hypothetical protein B0H34DRAFT_240657 [Crassisporium funariophilum]|nr:hypothetical protein B0H34DRAFT_240657 [Crassisporium funariophilum]